MPRNSSPTHAGSARPTENGTASVRTAQLQRRTPTAEQGFGAEEDTRGPSDTRPRNTEDDRSYEQRPSACQGRAFRCAIAREGTLSLHDVSEAEPGSYELLRNANKHQSSTDVQPRAPDRVNRRRMRRERQVRVLLKPTRQRRNPEPYCCQQRSQKYLDDFPVRSSHSTPPRIQFSSLPATTKCQKRLGS